ncbi:hypothetical protein ACN47E_001711 [Coniothyrium glycines]
MAIVPHRCLLGRSAPTIQVLYRLDAIGASCLEELLVSQCQPHRTSSYDFAFRFRAHFRVRFRTAVVLGPSLGLARGDKKILWALEVSAVAGYNCRAQAGQSNHARERRSLG